MKLDSSHWLRASVRDAVKLAGENVSKVRDVSRFAEILRECEYVDSANIKETDLSTGASVIKAEVSPGLFYKVLSEKTGVEISGEEELMDIFSEFIKIKKSYERLKDAIDEVEATGYGIVMPTIDELSLEEPEIMKQGGKYGVRLKASAPSIHMMRADITTEVAPIVGSESQSEELVMYLLKEFEENPAKIWDSNIFGKSLHELVNEGLHNKLYRMPNNARMKLQETLEKVINEGCSGLICIII